MSKSIKVEKGNWMIRRVETVLGTPIKSECEWCGYFHSKEEAMEAAKASLRNFSPLSGIAAKYEVAYMK